MRLVWHTTCFRRLCTSFSGDLMRSAGRFVPDIPVPLLATLAAILILLLPPSLGPTFGVRLGRFASASPTHTSPLPMNLRHKQERD